MKILTLLKSPNVSLTLLGGALISILVSTTRACRLKVNTKCQRAVGE
jgi:hypothetical protein